jgi:hypothetical protein
MGEDRKIICTSISNTADNDNGFPSWSSELVRRSIKAPYYSTL